MLGFDVWTMVNRMCTHHRGFTPQPYQQDYQNLADCGGVFACLAVLREQLARFAEIGVSENKGCHCGGPLQNYVGMWVPLGVMSCYLYTDRPKLADTPVNVHALGFGFMCSSFVVLAMGFLVRDYNVLRKREQHRRVWVVLEESTYINHWARGF